MYDRGVLTITIKLDYSKVLSTEYWHRGIFLLPVPWYYFSKVLSTGTAVLLRSIVPTIEH